MNLQRNLRLKENQKNYIKEEVIDPIINYFSDDSDSIEITSSFDNMGINIPHLGKSPMSSASTNLGELTIKVHTNMYEAEQVLRRKGGIEQIVKQELDYCREEFYKKNITKLKKLGIKDARGISASALNSVDGRLAREYKTFTEECFENTALIKELNLTIVAGNSKDYKAIVEIVYLDESGDFIGSGVTDEVEFNEGERNPSKTLISMVMSNLG